MGRSLIADVHASLRALRAARDSAGSVNEAILLGDVVVYGLHFPSPSPSETTLFSVSKAILASLLPH